MKLIITPESSGDFKGYKMLEEGTVTLVEDVASVEESSGHLPQQTSNIIYLLGMTDYSSRSVMKGQTSQPFMIADDNHAERKPYPRGIDEFVEGEQCNCLGFFPLNERVGSMLTVKHKLRPVALVAIPTPIEITFEVYNKQNQNSN